MGLKENIVVGMIGLIGTLGAATLGNWDKIFTSDKPNTSTTSPSSSSVTKTLEVNADSYKGTPYRNTSNTPINVEFKVEPNDTWLAIPEDEPDIDIPEFAKGYLSADGALNFESNKTPCRQVPLGALIVVRENEECAAYGKEGSFELEIQETVYFLMNDVFYLDEYNEYFSLYGDNKGSIKINVSKFEN
jgi:hypothetical protein